MEVQEEMCVFRGTIAEMLSVEWTMQRSTERLIPFVFHRNGRPIKDYYGTWRKACKAAKIQNRIAHDFRRTAVRNLERAGVPRSVAKQLTGHKTDAVYNRCAIVSEADLSEGLKKLATLHEQDAKAVTESRSFAVLSQP